ncbi:MAG: VCBS repeat-containing protein [Abditibacteriales bacterium]|nr:VCBS repeat-containing protein [Abditibacteriales bacterium]MDW8367351.1 VCBS repeat-containing protein [Abditibacteriales bacterium]
MRKSWWLEFFIVVVLVGGAFIVLRQRYRTPAVVQVGSVILPADVVQSGTGRDRRGDHLYALCADGVLYEFVLRGRHPALLPLVNLGEDFARLTEASRHYPHLRGWDFNRDGQEEIALVGDTLFNFRFTYSRNALTRVPTVELVYERDRHGRFVRNRDYEKRWARQPTEWRQPLRNPNPKVDGKPFTVSYPPSPFIAPPATDWFSRWFPALSRHLSRPSTDTQEVSLSDEQRTIGKIQGVVAWIIDLDGDGNDEIVTYDFDNPQVAPSHLIYHLYRYEGGKFRKVWSDKFLENQGNSTFIVDIADLDNDGLKELVFIEPVNRRGVVMGLSPQYWGRGK